MQLTGKKVNCFILVTCALSMKQIASYLQVMAVSMSSALPKGKPYSYLR